MDAKVDHNRCEERVVAIGENEVQVRQLLFDSSGREVVVDTETYGMPRADAEIEKVTYEMAELDAFDVAAEKAKVQTRLDRLNTIKAKLTEAEAREAKLHAKEE